MTIFKRIEILEAILGTLATALAIIVGSRLEPRQPQRRETLPESHTRNAPLFLPNLIGCALHGPVKSASWVNLTPFATASTRSLIPVTRPSASIWIVSEMFEER